MNTAALILNAVTLIINSLVIIYIIHEWRNRR